MNADDYFRKTKKRPPKTKLRSKPLLKPKEAYLEEEEKFEHALGVLGIKYEKRFQFKSTKHWRFDFHLIEHRILVEISGGSWSGGCGGKLANKALSLDRYDDAAEMGYTVVRIESAINDSRVRPAHLALNRIVLPIDPPFWLTHYPPWIFDVVVLLSPSQRNSRLNTALH